MKKVLFLLPFILCSCSIEEPEKEKETPYNDYGAFLGRENNDITNFENYKYLSFEFDEYCTSKKYHYYCATTVNLI